MDLADAAQVEIDAQLSLRIANARKRFSATVQSGNGSCTDCEAQIHPMRLAAMPNAQRCITCQTRFERSD